MIVGYVSSDIKESDDDVDDWDFLSMGMFDVTFEISGILYETTYDIVTVVKFLHEKNIVAASILNSCVR